MNTAVALKDQKVVSLAPLVDRIRSMTHKLPSGASSRYNCAVSVFVAQFICVDNMVHDLLYETKESSSFLTPEELETLRTFYRNASYMVAPGQSRCLGDSVPGSIHLTRKFMKQIIPSTANEPVLRMIDRLEDIFLDHLADENGNLLLDTIKQIRNNRQEYPLDVISKEKQHWTISGKYFALMIPVER